MKTCIKCGNNIPSIPGIDKCIACYYKVEDFKNFKISDIFGTFPLDFGWTFYLTNDEYSLLSKEKSLNEYFRPFMYEIVHKIEKKNKIVKFFKDIVFKYSEISTCNRRKVGAIITINDRIISTGTNGSVSGLPHCDEEGCLIEDNHCVRTVHAEINAILNCANLGISLKDSIMYSTDFPCFRCISVIGNSNIKSVVYFRDYVDKYNKSILAGISDRISFYYFDGEIMRRKNG